MKIRLFVPNRLLNYRNDFTERILLFRQRLTKATNICERTGGRGTSQYKDNMNYLISGKRLQ